MLTSNHYVPVLKWKRAEQGALEELADNYRYWISPLIELVMPKPKKLYEDKKNKTREEIFYELINEFRVKRIPGIPEEIKKSWGIKPIFIDFTLLYTTELKVESIKRILEKAAVLGLKPIPVLNLSDDERIKNQIRQTHKKYGQGICIRIVRSDLENTDKLNNELNDILKITGTSRSDIDLLVDIKEIKDNGEYYLKNFKLSQDINHLDKWRNFIFACGSFPENLSECTLDEQKLVHRIEWTCWLGIRNMQPKRIPTFADYTIRNPIYNETLQFYHSTSSIKYTFKDDWLILKSKVKKPEIYLASAALLIKDERFYGEDFSSGDKFIAERAKHFKTYIRNPKVKGTGSTESWLKAFINHHLALTAHQISSINTLKFIP